MENSEYIEDEDLLDSLIEERKDDDGDVFDEHEQVEQDQEQYDDKEENAKAEGGECGRGEGKA